MEEIKDKTLAQIVVENYKAAEIFEKYELDFCCRGKVSLEESCSISNLNLGNVLDELSNLYETKGNILSRFNTWDIGLLTDYVIQNHHAYVRVANERLLFYTNKIATKHGNRHPELYKIEEVFNDLAQELDAHMGKEEQILFPYFKNFNTVWNKHETLPESVFGSIENPIRRMMTEHDIAGDLIAEIKGLSNGFTAPADACNSYKLTFAELQEYEKDLHQHIHIENNILFPKAIAMENDLSPNQCSL